ncbi:hypothetical protein R1sor_001334 [Riccia sorocarpa]|uniref:Myb-like domain-containing protein n=1 Tax=Riccia sorocarpa TaxID=122646 RepID=A0ABD3GVN7_9MARC
MSVVIVNVSRCRRSGFREDSMVVKRSKRQVSARVFNRSDGGPQKAAPKADSEDNVTSTIMAVKQQQDQQAQGRKRKGKVPEAVEARQKETSSPIRRTRSRTLSLQKEKENSRASGAPVENGKSNVSKQSREFEDRQRGREAVLLGSPTLKKTSARDTLRSSRKFSPGLEKITEEKLASSAVNSSAAFIDTSETVSHETSPSHISGMPPQRKSVTAVRQKLATKELPKRTIKKVAAVKRKTALTANTARTRRTSPLPGLQELRRSGSRNAPNQERQGYLETTARESSVEKDDLTGAQESIVEDGDQLRVTRSRSTTDALRIAEDATGLVRTAMNAVVQARLKEELQQKQQRLKKSVVDIIAAGTLHKDESQRSKTNHDRSTRSTRRRKGLTAEKLIKELDSYHLADAAGQTGGVDMKEKLRKGLSRLTRSQSKSQGISTVAAAEKKSVVPTKLPRVANQENLPKATQSALVRRLKEDIEDHAKKYGLLDQERTAPEDRGDKKELSSHTVDHLQHSGSGPENDSRNSNEWTPEQEMALQNAYITVKPAADFWYHISKRVPGKTPEECFNKFYAGHPTPPAAQKSKRQTQKATGNDVDMLDDPEPKRVTAKGKQRLLQAHRTIRNILRKQQVEDVDYEADAFVALERPDVVESVLNSEEAKQAVIFKVTEVPNCIPEATSETNTNKPFEHIVIGGLPASDKENRNVNAGNSRLGRAVSDLQAQCTSPEVLKKVKNPGQLDKYIDHLHQRHNSRRPKTGSQRHGKKSNVYLHSKEALDFGDNTLSAIQRAKEELRNVFLKSGVTGSNVLDNVSAGEEEGEDEEEPGSELSSDGYRVTGF